MKVSRESKQLDQRKKEKYICQSPTHSHLYIKIQKKKKRKEKKILDPLFNFDKLNTESNQEILSAAVNSSVPKCLNPSLVMQCTHQCDIKCRISGAKESILLEMPLLFKLHKNKLHSIKAATVRALSSLGSRHDLPPPTPCLLGQPLMH